MFESDLLVHKIRFSGQTILLCMFTINNQNDFIKYSGQIMGLTTKLYTVP